MYIRAFLFAATPLPADTREITGADIKRKSLGSEARH
jgi:hypothetical protein